MKNINKQLVSNKYVGSSLKYQNKNLQNNKSTKRISMFIEFSVVIILILGYFIIK